MTFKADSYKMESSEVPECWSHSVKIEDTAKGARVSIHVYAKSESEAVESAISTYENTKARLIAHDIPLAPMERLA